MKKPKPEPLTLPELRRAAVDLLSRRDHSRTELQRKLRPKAASADDLETLLDELAERRWQSDERFAEAYLNSRIQRGQGPMRLRYALREKGVNDRNIQQAMEGQETDWFALALETARRKFGDSPDLRDQKQKARLYRFLTYRGFSSDQIAFVIDNIGNSA